MFKSFFQSNSNAGAKPAAAASAGGGGTSILERLRVEMFDQISDKLNGLDPNVVREFGGVFLFCLMNKQNVKHWTMDLNKIKIYPGEPEDDEDPDATFTMTEEVLEQLARGKTTARAAVQAGKCSVNGNIMKAMKLEPYMKL